MVWYFRTLCDGYLHRLRGLQQATHLSHPMVFAEPKFEDLTWHDMTNHNISSLHIYKLTNLVSAKTTRKIYYILYSWIINSVRYFFWSCYQKVHNIVQSKHFIKYWEKGEVLRRTHRLLSYCIDFYVLISITRIVNLFCFILCYFILLLWRMFHLSKNSVQ